MNDQHTDTAAAESELELAVADYLERLDRGEEVDRDEFAAQHPQIAPQLREFFAASEIVEQFTGQSSVGSPRALNDRETAASFTTDKTLAFGDPPGALSSKSAGELPPNFGRYLVLTALGQGAMGSVYLAYDTQLDRLVALKVPRFAAGEDPVIVARFYREARASATLRHPNICPLFDVGQIDGIHFLSMAYIEGQTLAAQLEDGPPVPVARAIEIVRKVALALDEAHRHGVVHRDLKPANIIIDPQGEPIVMDFGLARRVGLDDPSLTSAGTLVGSPTYMSPEQVEGDSEQIGPPSDIYALGVILYQLLTGEAPFRGTILSIIPKILYVQPRPPAELRPEIRSVPGLEAACLRMLAKRPQERFSTMADVAAALGEIASSPVQGPSILAGEEPTPPPLPGEVEPPPVLCARASIVPPIIAQSAGNITAPAQPTEQDPSAGALATWPSWIRPAIAVCLAGLILVPLGALGYGWGFGPGRVGARSGQTAGVPDPAPDNGHAAPEQNPGAADLEKREPVAPEPPLPVKDPSKAEPATAAAHEAPAVVSIPTPWPRENLAEIAYTLETEAVASDPFGVGLLDVHFETGKGPRLRPDQAIQLLSADKRAFYPAYVTEFELPPDADDPANPNDQGPRLSRLAAYFLTTGKAPVEVRLAIDAVELVPRQRIELKAAADNRQPLLDKWWMSYQHLAPERRSQQACEVQNFLNAMLSRRLKLPPGPLCQPIASDNSLLENFFEEVSGKLLGFDSVTVGLGSSPPAQVESLAMERADCGLPAPVNMRSVPVDPRAHPGATEQLAQHVPEECFYLRCQSASNYLWFRSLLMEWGGSLEEVVSSRTHDHQIRPRLERQLAIRADEKGAAVLAPLLSDLALIGFDVYFEEGAAVGVLLQSKPGQSPALQRWIDDQRSAAVSVDPEAVSEQPVATPAGHSVRLLSTRDGRVHSYYAVDGDQHLVTNCERLVDRFFEAGRGDRNLAALQEFRLARGLFQVNKQDTFLYLSDPFFRNLASPAYRVECLRRSRSAADLRRVALARLAAQSEGRPHASIDQLVDGGLLPAYFVQRQDGIRLKIDGPLVYDEDRGQAGTFCPIPDLHITAATRSEVAAYDRFAGEIRREWGVMDPVSLLLTRQPLQDGRETVNVEIKVTPYAKDRYATLTSALAPASNKRIVHPESDVLSLEAALRTPGGSRFLAYAGLADAAIQYEVKQGKIRILNPEIASGTYASSQSYLALSRFGDNELRVMERVWKSLNITDPIASLALLKGLISLPKRILDLLFGSFTPTTPAGEPTWFPRPAPAANGWGVLAFNSELGQQRAAALAERGSAEEPAQVRFSMRDIRGSQVGPYIRAYSYLEARQASARNANLMDLMIDQLHVPRSELEAAIESATGVKLLCPLGGTFHVTNGESGGSYAWSDKWPQRSFTQATSEIPADYEFAFVNWLRGFQIQFKLDGETLSAHAQLEIKPVRPPRRRPLVY